MFQSTHLAICLTSNLILEKSKLENVSLAFYAENTGACSAFGIMEGTGAGHGTMLIEDEAKLRRRCVQASAEKHSK